jgi:small-conductance mechanosensitive channel
MSISMNKHLLFSWTAGILLLVSHQLHAQVGDSVKNSVSDSSVQTSTLIHYVKFNRDTIFPVQASLGPYTAEERAQVLTERLKEIYAEERIKPDSFQLSTEGDFSVISYKGQRIYYVSDRDADQAGISRDSLAQGYLDSLHMEFSVYEERRTVSYWLIRIGFTLLSILGLVIILTLLNRAYRWGQKRLSRYEQGIKRKRKNFLRYLLPHSNRSIFSLVLQLLRIALFILILVLYLPFMFSFLPWTERVVAQFYGYIAKPVRDILQGLLQFLPNLFYIFVIAIITRYVIRVFSYLTKEIEKEKLVLKGFYKDWAQPTFTIIKILLLAFALVFIFPYLPGSSSPAFRGVSIFLGVLFSLGSTSAIANIVAGIVITYMRPFSVGDRVQIGQSIGDVIERNLLVTRLRTIKNEDITIPNSLIINSHLWNYSSNASELGIILHTSVTIGYDVPSETVTELLLKAAENTKNLTRDFKPFVLQKSLDDFYVEYELNVYTKQPKKMAFFYSELHKSIREAFNKAGVEIMSPHYSAFRDGNARTIPPDPSPKKSGPDDSPAPDPSEKKRSTKKSEGNGSPGSEPTPPPNPVEQILDKVTGKK